MKADAAQLKLAKQLIDAYTQPFELSAFKDHCEEALRELVEAKINNLPVAEEPVEKKQGKVIDLMEALRKSLLQKKPVQVVDEDALPETAHPGRPKRPENKPVFEASRLRSPGARHHPRPLHARKPGRLNQPHLSILIPLVRKPTDNLSPSGSQVLQWELGSLTKLSSGGGWSPRYIGDAVPG